jgi:outer membrane protein TolC
MEFRHMIRHVSGLWLLLLWPSVPWAQDVPIRSDRLPFSAALSLAEAHSPTLVAQAAAVAAARSSAIPAAALPDPKLVIGADNVPISGADRFDINRDFMTMEKIGVMQEVPNSDKRQARAEVAAAAVARASAAYAVERLKVREATATAWLTRFYLERRLTVLGEFDRENALLAAATQAQLRAGKAVAGDAVLPAQEAADFADRRDELMQAIAEATADLKRWIGDDAALPLVGDAPALGFDPLSLHQHLHHHPELAAYGPMADLAQAEIREAEAEKKSDWGVELDYQRRAAPFSDMVSLQFTFDLPVFTGSRQGPRIEAKRQALVQVDAERAAMLREHTAALDRDLARYGALKQQLARLQQTRLPLAQQKLDLQMGSYRSGQADLIAVLSARREWIETRLRQIDLESQLAVLSAQLYFAYEEPFSQEDAR